MGKYINNIDGTSLGASFQKKCQVLQSKGAVKVTGREYTPGNMVIVVDNGHFAAAGYAYSEDEWKVFQDTNGRPYQWYLLENAGQYATD
jgi:hypothetical protein